MSNKIKIINASEHNLKNITVEIPKNKLVVMTGVSGSGKTTLAFDTLYQEGQRRYIESLSSYARQFLGNFEKPKVEKIIGLSPAISIDQKTKSNNPRSTVGTVTEIYDFLRLLFSGISRPFDLKTNQELKKFSPTDVTDFILNNPKDEKLVIGIYAVKNKTVNTKKIKERFLKMGFIRGYLNNKEVMLEDLEDMTLKGNFQIVVDRILNKKENKSRLFEAIELSYKIGEGFCFIKKNDQEFEFNEEFNFKNNLKKIIKEPRLFSFNTPLGACPYCNGHGINKDIDEDLILDKEKSLFKGGIIPYKNADTEGLLFSTILQVCEFLNLDPKTKIKKIEKEKLDIILYGTHKFSYELTSTSGNKYSKNDFEGILNLLNRRLKETKSDWIREWLDGFTKETTCPKCKGHRLNDEALCFKINNYNISEVANLNITDAIAFFNNLSLTNTEQAIAKTILTEINSRLNYLKDVGLSYLSLSRKSATLSGGEAQRIRLATQIGSNLSGVLYVLDEPSIGLHQKDNEKLINTLKNMRDLGNTVVVVEHDEETILNSDHVIDIGPKAGYLGGKLLFSGTPEDLLKEKNNITADFLSNRKKIDVPKQRRKRSTNSFLKIKNASENNLKNISIDIPLGVMCLVTGVSGSGKSSLVHDVLLNNLKNKLYKSKESAGKVEEINFKGIEKIIEISQDPIGKTPRSNPATYTGLFDEIREIFSSTQLAKARGYNKGRFSFNLKGGRCSNCKGDGQKRISMHFLPDVYVKCETCQGKRYNAETLDVKYKNKSIYDVLEMTASDALDFFKEIPKAKSKLEVLNDVGLGYMKLGQIAPTLSGGEAQRVKLATELSKKITKETLYILDEPTTGLHTHDVKNLLKVLNKIVNKGGSMIIIEHNLDIIKSADYIIDLGPEGGNLGGNIIAKGTPEEVAQNKNSYTGQYLKGLLNK